ncbi:MAG TPA: four helix bundle protein [Solirubrobacterales bacterium]|nr:four helix bundle protein [Solirubrobacterales bacterium]
MGKFENLIAYQQAVSLADDLREVIRDWPNADLWTLGVQLVRAADSVGANIAEGFGRGSNAEENRFLLIARGSANETQHWIERAFARSLIDDDSFRVRAAAVCRLVNGLHRAHRARARATGDR